jgi:hypothetical protein
MLKSIEGIYRDGKIELLEPAPPEMGEARVVVTFLPTKPTNLLADRGITPAQAADLRARLGTFVEDWDDPAMDIYDED